MDYLPVATILALWYWDPMLLVKIRNQVKKHAVSLAFSGLGAYHRCTEADNEMLKPGYHVDFVYLLHKTSKYDITSTFRAELLCAPFRRVPVMDLLEKCCKRNSNLCAIEPDGFYRVEIRYTFDCKQYLINFDTHLNNMITFPLIGEKELREQIDYNYEGILSAVYERTDSGKEVDISDELLKMSGPLQDFYKPHGIVVLKSWMPSEWGHSGAIDCDIKLIDMSGTQQLIKGDHLSMTPRHRFVDDSVATAEI